MIFSLQVSTKNLSNNITSWLSKTYKTASKLPYFRPTDFEFWISQAFESFCKRNCKPIRTSLSKRENRFKNIFSSFWGVRGSLLSTILPIAQNSPTIKENGKSREAKQLRKNAMEIPSAHKNRTNAVNKISYRIYFLFSIWSCLEVLKTVMQNLHSYTI